MADMTLTAERRVSAKAAWAMGLALSSYVLLPLVGAVAGLFLASQAEAEIRRDASLDGLGLVRFARVVAWFHLATLFVGVALLFMVLLGAFAG